jgi:hypothetical protein
MDMTQFERSEVHGCCYHCGRRGPADWDEYAKEMCGLALCFDCAWEYEIEANCEDLPFIPIPTMEWGI